MQMLHKWALGAGIAAGWAGVAGGAVVVDYPMNETSGTLTDIANGVNMTPQNESAFTYGVPSVPAGTYGGITVSPAQAALFGTAVSGDGSNIASNSATGNALNSLASPFTIMAWINPSITAGRQRILSGSYGDGNGWGYGVDGGNQIFTSYGVTDYGP